MGFRVEAQGHRDGSVRRQANKNCPQKNFRHQRFHRQQAWQRLVWMRCKNQLSNRCWIMSRHRTAAGRRTAAPTAYKRYSCKQQDGCSAPVGFQVLDQYLHCGSPRTTQQGIHFLRQGQFVNFRLARSLRDKEILKVPVLNGCHCGLDPQSMAPNSWMPGQARHDMGTLEISASLNCVLASKTLKLNCSTPYFIGLLE